MAARSRCRRPASYGAPTAARPGRASGPRQSALSTRRPTLAHVGGDHRPVRGCLGRRQEVQHRGRYGGRAAAASAAASAGTGWPGTAGEDGEPGTPCDAGIPCGIQVGGPAGFWPAGPRWPAMNPRCQAATIKCCTAGCCCCGARSLATSSAISCDSPPSGPKRPGSLCSSSRTPRTTRTATSTADAAAPFIGSGGRRPT